MFNFSNYQRTPKVDRESEKNKPERKAKFWLLVMNCLLAVLKFIVWLIDRS